MLEVLAFVSRGVLPSLREGGWVGFGSLQRTASLVGDSNF